MKSLRSIAAATVVAGIGACLVVSPAQASLYNIKFSGVFESILDSNGNTGGAFDPSIQPSLAPSIGDSFSGRLQLDTSDLSSISSIAGSVLYESSEGFVSHNLVIDGVSISLTRKTRLGVIDNGDLNPLSFAALYRGGVRESGFDPVPTSIDLLSVHTPEISLANETGFQADFVTFDPTGLALTGTSVPAPFSLLSNSFFLFEQYDNTIGVAAAFAKLTSASVQPVPEPATFVLIGFGLLGLRAVRQRKTIS